jgi:predicted RNase H-like HicB family nuclease
LHHRRRHLREAIVNVHEAIAGFLETLAKLGEPIPREEPGLIAVAVEIDAPTPTLAGAVA